MESVKNVLLFYLTFSFFQVLNSEKVVPRYIVFPGLDAGSDEVAEWNYGFTSPFNVFFGPKPYVLGWVGEAPFGPIEEEEEIEEGEEDFEEGEIGEDYEYEKL